MEARGQHPYTANYCEENVWHLAASAALHPGERRVVLVSSLGDAVPLWCQRAAANPGDVVLWDYHVFLAVIGRERWIYDLDTTLPFPCPLPEYLERTFGPGRGAPTLYRPHFRVVDGPQYRRAFSSDREHMRRQDGAWMSPPPPWPIITGQPPLLPLPAAIDMTDHSVPGALCELEGLDAALR